jgi:hypothetical protein
MRGNELGAFALMWVGGFGRTGPLALFCLCLRRRRGIAHEGLVRSARERVGGRGRIGGISGNELDVGRGERGDIL